MNRIVAALCVLPLASAAALAQEKPAQQATTAPQSTAHKGNRADAYYHYTMAHMYEELVTIYGRSDLANKAIEEYRQAIEADPDSSYLTAGLAELYAKTGRIRDAVMEAQDILKHDPNNLEAHKLLGRIYLRSMGDVQNGSQNQNVIKLAIEQYEEIIKLEKDSDNLVEDHLLLGRLYRLNNDLTKAENEFKTAVKLQPDSEEAVTTLAYLYNEEGDSGHAIQALNSVPEASRSAKLYSALGYTYEQEKQYKQAIEAYRHAIELDRDNLDAIRGLAQNLQNDGQTQAALDQYKIIADANPEDSQTYARMAEIYKKQGQFDQALENLKKAEAIVPDSIEYPYEMASVYQAQGRYEEAAQTLKELLDKTQKPDENYTPSDKNNRAVFLERLGSDYRDMGNSQLAIETFRKMLTLGDENVARGYQEIIDTYREQKDWPQATATAKEAVQKLPNNRDLKMVLASQLADTGQSDAALQQVKSLLSGKAEDREVYIALAQMYSRLKRWPEAEEAINKADQLSTKPDDKEYTAFVKGSIYERQKKYEPAEQEFKRILSADPQNAMTLNYYGYMLADRGVRLDEALAYIKKAVELDPANGAYLDSLGWAYYKLGKYDQAEENLSKALQHTPNDPTVQDHMGDVYQKTGRLKQAAAHWERAVSEWNRTIPAEIDNDLFSRVQRKLESAKIKLAKEEPQQK
ncbi:MAG: tetratricopeptide repeat protein [Acidobacteria bacterium]|nr:tetratricopeptide repeat protein [Acidobacteriota bacterium]